MNYRSDIQSVHSVIDHLTGITSQKDLDLLTISLLKSLGSLIPNAELRVITLDQAQLPIKTFSISNGDYKIKLDDIVLGPEAKQAITRTHRGNLNRYTDKTEDHFVSVYLMHHDRQSTTYLLLNTPRQLNHSEDYLLTGVLEIFQNFSSLLVHAQTDELTGLANRKTFESAINRVYDLRTNRHNEYPSNKRHGETSETIRYWLCALDIDHFKAVNDIYGHLYGDEVLIRLAQVMKSHFRNDDLLFRFGGEEFIIVLRAPDKTSAVGALERFRGVLADTTFAGVETITVSMGVVEIDPSVFHKTLMDYADQALYHSKKNGRDQITFFEQLIEMGIAKQESYEEGTVDLF